MRKIILLISLLTIAACGQRPSNPSVPLSILDSLEIQSELGDVVRRHYNGIIPCADCPGIEYDLVLYNQEHSGDGVYELNRTYLEGDEDGRDYSSYTTGRWITLRGDAVNNDATVYQLSPRDSLQRQNLLMLGDSIIILDSEFEKLNPLIHTLRIVTDEH